MTFQELVNSRRSVRVFDQKHDFDHEAVRRSLELAVLSPNSSNLQLWEFYRILSPEIKEKFTHACMGQSAARTASELVVFVSRRDKWRSRTAWNFETIKKQAEGRTDTNAFKRAKQYYTQLIPLFYRKDFLGINTLIRWAVGVFRDISGKPMMRFVTHADQRIVAHKSTALAAQTFMLAMQAEGYATCPMEGFDERIVKKLLKLLKGSEITMIVACGKSAPEGVYAPRTRLPNNEIIFTV